MYLKKEKGVGKYIVCDVKGGQECQLDQVATLISPNETFQAYTDV